MYGILFVPTSRILKYSAKVRFGRKGLHPDLFETYMFENAGTMAPLEADVDALDKPLSSGDLSDTLVVLDERCEQMVNWVNKVLSRNMAARLLEFFEWGSREVKDDRKGLWTLTDWKCLILDVLDDATRHIDVQLGACKMLCEGGVDEDALFPSLAKVRLVAMTKRADGTRSIKPAWAPLVLVDTADSSGVVTLASKVAALRAKQLEATEYERNRAGAVARAAAKKRALERSLCSKATGGGASSKVRAGGHEAGSDVRDSDVSGGDSDGDAGGSAASSSARSRRKRDKDVCEIAGLLVGPAVRAPDSAGVIGTRMMELGEREQLRDPSCQICAEGKEVCLKNCTHNG